jgi:hypothetical protein
MLVGIFTAGLALHAATGRRWHDVLLNGLFAVVFGGVGVGGTRLLLLARRKLQEQEQLKAKHPAEPWQWRKDWSSGRIEDSSTQILWLAWVFAAFWNLVSFPAGLIAVRSAWQQHNPAIYIALLFPAIGTGLLVWAVKASLRYKRYGSSRLELTTVPASIGHSLEGMVRATGMLQPPGGFRLTLSCVRRLTTGTGSSRSTSEGILWQDQHPVTGAAIRDPEGWATRIPVAFRIPADALGCTSENPDDVILWRLTVTASVPGVDYASIFEVPVFRTAASAEAPTRREAEIDEEESRAIAEYRQPPGSRIQVSASGAGVAIVFPAARNPGAAAGVTAFGLIWGSLTWALIHFHAPLIFPIVFGGFELLLVWFSLQLWLGVSRITATAGSLLVASGLGEAARERSVATSSIADVTTAIGMQAGATPYYDVVVQQKDGKKVVAGRAVRDKREAEWIALTIKRGLGLPANAA